MAGTIITEVLNNIDRVLTAMKFTKENEVLIGIPQKETSREEDPVTNAELLFIHTNGSPINNVPARPVIEPAIFNSRKEIADIMKKAINQVMDGKEDEALSTMEQAGIKGQNVSRAWFVDSKNSWPPNSPAVQRAKRKKGSTNPRPLIDTGELRKSITYVVVRKGQRKEHD